MNKTRTWLLLVALSFGVTAFADSKEVITVTRFEKGDKVPVSVLIEGDLVEGAEDTAVVVKAKRTFFIQTKKGQMSLSLDGKKFRPVHHMVGGELGAGISDDGIDVRLKAVLK